MSSRDTNDGMLMDEFIIEFGKIKDMQKEEIAKLFEKQRDEMKEFFFEVKAELKKIEPLKDNLIRLEVKHENLQRDVNALAANFRDHTDDDTENLDDLKKIKWEISLAKWLGGLGIGVACSTLVVVIAAFITKKIGG